MLQGNDGDRPNGRQAMLTTLRFYRVSTYHSG
jgi:hypothetical protein